MRKFTQFEAFVIGLIVGISPILIFLAVTGYGPAALMACILVIVLAGINEEADYREDGE